MGTLARSLLLVEGDDAYRAVLEAAFARAGYRVLSSADAIGGVAHLDGELTPVTLALLDWSTPTRDGLALVNALADDPRHGATPLIVLADVASIAHVPELRVAAVVTKPARVRWLLSLAERLSGPFERDAGALPLASVDHPTAIVRRPREMDSDAHGRTNRLRRRSTP